MNSCEASPVDAQVAQGDDLVGGGVVAVVVAREVVALHAELLEVHAGKVRKMCK